jgi:hypothetical protein
VTQKAKEKKKKKVPNRLPQDVNLKFELSEPGDPPGLRVK